MKAEQQQQMTNLEIPNREEIGNASKILEILIDNHSQSHCAAAILAAINFGVVSRKSRDSSTQNRLRNLQKNSSGLIKSWCVCK